MSLSNPASRDRATTKEKLISTLKTARNGNNVGVQVAKTVVKNEHPRFEKEFAVSRHQPFSETSNHIQCIKNADSVKNGEATQACWNAAADKVYLF